MKIPKIVVKQIDIETNIKIVTRFISPTFNKHNKTLSFTKRSYQLFPELVGKINNDMSDKEVREIVAPVVIKKLKENKEQIENRIIDLKDEFSKIGAKLLITLADVHETKWPDDCNYVYCYVGYIPMCPRNVRTKEYYVSCHSSLDSNLKTSVHEMGHFMFYEKWQEIYGPVAEKDISRPAARWYLEEMIVDPLLNDERIQNIIPGEQKAYKQFYTEMIDGLSIIGNIKKIHNNSNSIEDFIKKAYFFISNNIDEINRKCN